jgi:hypothetical protein
MMTLKYNSFNAKLYRYFYGTENMPKSICPYFWKLLMAWLFIVPVTLLCFPVVIGEIIQKESYGLQRMFYTFILFIFLIWISSMVCAVLLIFNDYEKGSMVISMGSIGIIVWLFMIIVGTIEGVKYVKDSGKISNSVIVGFVSSKYNKYCARITWK